MTRQSSAPLSDLSLSPTNRPVEFFVWGVERGHIVLDAAYQRGTVWTADQRMSLIKSWLQGIPIGAVVINHRPHARTYDDGSTGSLDFVIDGKQRIETAILWMTDQFACPASWWDAGSIVTTEDTADGPYVRFGGLSESAQRRWTNHTGIATAEAHVATEAAEADIYLLINGGGTPQTASDMANAARVAASEK